MADDQNPRAFPSAAIDDRWGGMTLRDWFAGQSIQQAYEAALMLPPGGHDQPMRIAKAAAVIAYQISDAMMAERAKRGQANG